MKPLKIFSFILTSGILFTSCAKQASQDIKILLRNDWAIQSSKEVNADGSIISAASFKPEKWYPATVPSTVFGTLVENKVYPDPYYGTNIESVPGYIRARRGEIPDDSPFRPAWWYRTAFTLPREFRGKNIWINFQSINYKANIWLNGKLIADTTSIEGAYRLYNLDITKAAKPGRTNCLALEIFPPRGTDLTITWVDWNPTPPDRGTGIWYDVSVNSTGPVSIENPWVRTKLNLPATDLAKLTVSADVSNVSKKQVTGTLTGNIESISFSQDVTLAPGENRQVTFDPDNFTQLQIKEPRLWWPHTLGTPNLYNLKLTFAIKEKVSDIENVRFGIREITSWMNDFDGKHTKVFQVNGKNIVVKGGGYVEDMMLRPDEKRVDTDIAYARHMGLNTLRMEAPRGSDYVFQKCEEEGIMLMVGWCCCSSWERWKTWTPHVADIAEMSLKDQILHHRNSPSFFTWLNGSDMHPTPEIEKRYIDVVEKYDGTRPYQSSATSDSSTVSGNTGLYMGPFPLVYAYRPPSYWYSKLEYNTEAAPAGEQIPPLETMRKMMPEKDLWPMSESWTIRLHKNFFPPMREALNSRYGTPGSLEEYSIKSQVHQYEATRAMFEAFSANKYKSSGIIYWMYNSVWPSLYWQLYDYFLAPNGAFYGARKANEPLHIQYRYDDKAICVVNSQYNDFTGLKASAKIFDFNMKERYSKEVNVDVMADESKKIVFPGMPSSAGALFFLKLKLTDAEGKDISSNFYWLSSKGDEKADFTALNTLPKVDLSYSVSPLRKENGKCYLTMEIENPSKSLAFAVNPKIISQSSKDLILPVFWEDNYFALLPGEKRTVKAEFIEADLNGAVPALALDGWNINKTEKEIK